MNLHLPPTTLWTRLRFRSVQNHSWEQASGGCPTPGPHQRPFWVIVKGSQFKTHKLVKPGTNYLKSRAKTFADRVRDSSQIRELCCTFIDATRNLSVSLTNNRMGAKSLKNRASEGGSNGWVQSGRSLGVRGYPWLCPRAAWTRAKRAF